MPKCVQCDKYVHPDFSVLMEPDNEANKDCKCVFCYVGKSEITIEESDGKPAYKVTKKEAVEDYRVYIAKLKDDEKVSKVLAGNPMSKFNI